MKDIERKQLQQLHNIKQEAIKNLRPQLTVNFLGYAQDTLNQQIVEMELNKYYESKKMPFLNYEQWLQGNKSYFDKIVQQQTQRQFDVSSARYKEFIEHEREDQERYQELLKLHQERLARGDIGPMEQRGLEEELKRRERAEEAKENRAVNKEENKQEKEEEDEAKRKAREEKKKKKEEKKRKEEERIKKAEEERKRKEREEEEKKKKEEKKEKRKVKIGDIEKDIKVNVDHKTLQEIANTIEYLKDNKGISAGELFTNVADNEIIIRNNGTKMSKKEVADLGKKRLKALLQLTYENLTGQAGGK